MTAAAAAELLAATDAGDILRAQAALAAGATLTEALTAGGSNALHNAAFEGHTKMVQFLLAEGAAAGAQRETDGVTALDMAATNGHDDTVKVLVAAGAAVTAATTELRPPADDSTTPATAGSASPGGGAAAARMENGIPVVDWRRSETDREGFLSEILHALGDVGFMCLTHHPSFTADTQARYLEQAHAFFDAPDGVRESASIGNTPHFRGYAPPAYSPAQFSELFMYGTQAETRADPADETVPAWQRIFFGPNTWPREDEPNAALADSTVDPLAGFRPAVEALGGRYTDLHHQLGEMICDALAPQGSYDTVFDRDAPIAVAFLGRSFSPAEIQNVAAGSGELTGPAQAVVEDLFRQDDGNAHVDTTAFISLNTMDCAGLQVLTKGNDPRWVDVPVLPGGVCVNVGSALEHLSNGRLSATVHRVNTLAIPTENPFRISCPFFLMPMFGATLEPFRTRDGQKNGPAPDAMAVFHRSEYYYAFVLMSLYGGCTEAWWGLEFERMKARIAAVTDAAGQRAAY